MATINAIIESRSNDYNHKMTIYETELANHQNSLKELNESLKNTNDKASKIAINEKIEDTKIKISSVQNDIYVTKKHWNEESSNEIEIARKFAEELNSKDSYQTAGIDINNFMPKDILETLWKKFTDLF